MSQGDARPLAGWPVAQRRTPEGYNKKKRAAIYNHPTTRE